MAVGEASSAARRMAGPAQRLRPLAWIGAFAPFVVLYGPLPVRARRA